MRKTLGFVVGGCFIGLSTCSVAVAEPLCTPSFEQFGAPQTQLANTVSGCYAGDARDSVNFTVTGPGAGFELDHLSRVGGPFFDRTLIGNGYYYLYDNGTPGAISINYSTTPGQSNLTLPEALMFGFTTLQSGKFTATATAYAGSAIVATETLISTAGPGQYVTFELFARSPEISSVVISSTNDEGGVALISEYVPEPASWALMIIGFAGLGAVLRARRAREAPASFRRAG